MIVLVLLIGVVLKLNFGGSSDEVVFAEPLDTSSIDLLVNQVEAINFDTTVIEDGKFQSLKSIASPLISDLIGKRNPFSL